MASSATTLQGSIAVNCAGVVSQRRSNASPSLGMPARPLHGDLACRIGRSRGQSLHGQPSFLSSPMPAYQPAYRQASHVLQAVWMDNEAAVTVNVPVQAAFKDWDEKVDIASWMEWIKSVEVLEEDRTKSRWKLEYVLMGTPLSYSWVAKDLTPTANKKIHWRSVDGLPNRGAVRFQSKSPTSCTVKLSISYQVPDVLLPLGEALRPLVESILLKDMKSYVKYAEAKHAVTNA